MKVGDKAEYKQDGTVWVDGRRILFNRLKNRLIWVYGRQLYFKILGEDKVLHEIDRPNEGSLQIK